MKISQKCEKGRQKLIIHHVLIKVHGKIQDALHTHTSKIAIPQLWVMWHGSSTQRVVCGNTVETHNTSATPSTPTHYVDAPSPILRTTGGTHGKCGVEWRHSLVVRGIGEYPKGFRFFTRFVKAINPASLRP